MTSPLTFIEEQIALRNDMAARVEMMENHLANPQRSPSFGMMRNSESTTEEDIARLKEQLSEIDERIARVRAGNY